MPTNTSTLNLPCGISVMVDSVFGCHIPLNLRRDRDGYAMLGRQRAHVVVWEHAQGPVPPDREVEHRCRQRACCRHLELVTRGENERRKSWRHRSRLALPCGCKSDCAMLTPAGGKLCRLHDR